jgi:xanthine dehydrogenase accessory factor
MSQGKELQDIFAALRAGGALALATLFEARGSTYRRPGARFLVAAGGRTAGGVSGGCLEADLAAHAGQAAASGEPRIVTYDQTSDADGVFGLSLGCNGLIRVLVEPLPGGGSPEYLRFLETQLAQREPAAVAVVVRYEGRLPYRVGDRLWMTADGRLEGPLAGGPYAQRIAVDAMRLLGVGAERSLLKGYPCDASGLEVFIEAFQPPLSLVIFGAGHDAVPLAELAAGLGWRTTVVDHRPAYATRERFPAATVRLCRPEAVPEDIGLDAETAAVVMNHHYPHDKTILAKLLESPVRYIGLLGPRRRTEKMLAEFEAEGRVWDPARLARLHAPVGLDIGAETPGQVALAIVAEILAATTGRPGGLLKDRAAPIHAEAG